MQTTSPTGGTARPESPAIKPMLLDAASAPASAASAEAAQPATTLAAAAAEAAAAPEATASSARLIVGPEIKLKGAEISDCDTIIVEGEVDAAMDSRVVEIAERGVFRGRVTVEIAEIRGRFEGELTAHKRLVIRDTGRVAGKIRYGKISIDEGGELSGDVAAIDASEAARQAGSSRSLELRTTRETAAATQSGGSK